MANYLVASESLNQGAGHDGIVVDSTGKIFFLATYFVTAQNHLKIYKSTNGGQTWALVQDISPIAGGGTNRIFYAMYMDAGDKLHLCHWTTSQTYQYKRYDPPDYSSPAVNELAGGTADSFSPTGMVVTSAGVVYIFYQMTQTPAPQNYILRYGRRTGVNTWVMDTDLTFGASGLGAWDVDYLMSSDGSTIYLSHHLKGGFNSLTVRTLVGTTFSLLYTIVVDSVNRHNTWLAEVSGVVRAYDSKNDGVTGSAEIFWSTASGGRISLFTSSVSTDALRGVSQDPNGVNIFYGGASGALKRRRHNLDGTLTSEVVEVAAPTNYLLGQRDIFGVGYPRKIGNFAGGSGFYGQPAGATRFFSSLVDVSPPTITITIPTSGATFTTSLASLALAGTAADNVAVTSVTWSNDRGGSGTATGTTSWTATVPLFSGVNVITTTASDAAGNTGTDILTVTLAPSGGEGGSVGGMGSILSDWGLDETLLPRISGEELRRILGRRERKKEDIH